MEEEIEEPTDYVYYGDALEPLEEEDVASKKPIRIEDQEVRDEHGRRRFHGAFTGGFSAGYYNTVDTKEGWRPSEFKSSRSDRNKKDERKPEDYMDQEDLGSFGIAPQMLRAKDEFGDNQIGRRQTKPLFASKGPIPGLPALHDVFRPVKDTIGIELLKSMGWKAHHGTGERLSKKEKMKRRKKDIERLKTYSVSLPPGFKQAGTSDGEEDGSEDDDEGSGQLFAPDDVPAYVAHPKTNTFGLGYSGLRGPQGPSAKNISGFQLFEPTLALTDRKKKLQIAGQAFGVGAFEREDEDIYAKDDMSQYDFELGAAARNKKPAGRQLLALPASDVLDGFIRATKPETVKKAYPPPDIPRDFNRIHRSQRSRFDVKPMSETEIRGLGRHDLNAYQRAAIMEQVLDVPEGEPGAPSEPAAPPAKPTPAEVVAQALAQIRRKQEEMAAQAKTSLPVAPTPAPIVDPQKESKIASLKAFVQKSLTTTTFQPFARDPAKQFRFDAFNVLSKAGRLEEFRLLQPDGMTDWEYEREQVEFERSLTLYQPLTGTMQNRFTSGGHVEENIQGGLVAQIDAFLPKTEDVKIKREPVEKDPAKRAARRKHFGALTRNRVVWKPDRLLCIRFNVPNPFPDGGAGQNSAKLLAKGGGSGKFSIFDVLSAGPSFMSAGSENVPPGPVEGPAPKDVPELEWDKAEKGQLEENKSTEFADLTTPEEAQQQTTVKEEEEAPVERPSMDIFKAIFADSDSEDEEDEEPEETPKQTIQPVKQIKKEVQEELEEDAYGPRLPSSLTSLTSGVPGHPALLQPKEVLKDDEWVELDKVSTAKKHKKDKKDKKAKKHKKEKKSKKSSSRKRRHSSSDSAGSGVEEAKILQKIVALKKQHKL